MKKKKVKKKAQKKDALERALSYMNKKDEMVFIAHAVNADYLYTIKQVLKDRNIKPSDVAKKTLFTKSYVSQVLNGTRMINIPFIARIRNAFSIPLELVDTSNYTVVQPQQTITATRNVFIGYGNTIELIASKEFAKYSQSGFKSNTVAAREQAEIHEPLCAN